MGPLGYSKGFVDPWGSHAQGDLFLRAFLEHYKCNYCRFPSLIDKWAADTNPPRVYAEVPTALGRPDLLILLETKFALIIENKIDASPGPNQIERYREWLANQPEARSGETALLYLTPCPSPANDLPDGCFSLSYRDDIAQWVALCAHDSRMSSPRVQHSLFQYLDVIRGLCAEDLMSKEVQQSPVGEFVRHNALEIFELWEATRRELGDPRSLFWTKLAELVRQGLASRPRGNRNVALSSKDTTELSKPDASHLTIIESDSASGRLHCGFTMQEHAGVLQYGISWSEKVSTEKETRVLRASSEVVSLRDGLQSQDFKKHSWWVVLKPMTYNLDEKAFVMDLCSGDRLQRLVAEKILELFDHSADHVHKINQTLKKVKI